MFKFATLAAAAFLLNTNALQAGEVRITGQGFSIPDGETNPSVTRGTDYRGFPVGGTQLTHTFVIHNDGGTALELFSISENSSHFRLGSVPPPGPIAAGSSKSFDLAFDPQSVGVHNATVTVQTDDSNEGTYTFAVTGEGLGTAEIVVRGRDPDAPTWTQILDGDPDPGEIDGTDFGVYEPGDPVDRRTFQISNTGSAALDIVDLSVSGFSFIVDSSPNSVAAGATETFVLFLNVFDRSVNNATVTIRTNADNTPVFDFAITAKRLGSDPIVRGNNQLILDGDATPRVHDHTDFGQTDAGGAPITRGFTIVNEGDFEINVEAIIEDSPAFSISNLPGATPIPAGASHTFDVTFAPTAAGEKSTTILIAYDSYFGITNSYEFTIAGEALGEPALDVRGRKNANSPWRSISNGANSGDSNRGTIFDDTPVSGGLTTHTFQIRNTGNAQATISSIAVNSSEFVAANVPATVGAGQTQTFEVVFNPTQAGVRSGIVQIRSNAVDADPWLFRVEGYALADGAAIAVKGGDDVDLLYDVDWKWREIIGAKTTVTPLACDRSTGKRIANGDTTPSTADGTDRGPIFTPSQLPNPAPPPRPHFWYRIENEGDATLTITGVSLSGPGAGRYEFSSNEWAPAITILPIPAGGCVILGLRVVGGDSGPATINIISNDPDDPIFSFDISHDDYIFSTPEIGVFGEDGLTIGQNSTTTSLVAGTDLGIVSSVGTTVTSTLRVQNIGSGSLDLTSISSDDPQFAVSAPAFDPLATDEFLDFDVTFSPTSVGYHSALITIDSDADTYPSFVFTLDALAQPQSEPTPDPAPDLVIFGGDPMVRILRNETSPTPASGTDGGSVLVGEALSFKFRARNRGDAPLLLRDALAVGAPVIADDLVGQLDPGEHDDFTLNFVPPNAGTYLFPVLIESDDPDGDYLFAATFEATENPLLDGSGIEVISFAIDGDNAFLTFNAPTGADYRVVTNTDLGSTWNLVEGSLPGGGYHSVFIPGGGASERRMFRVEQE